MPVNPFYETLGACIDAIEARLNKDKVVLVEPYWTMHSRPVGYGCTENWNFEIRSLRGKPTKKFFHVNIYRRDSGRYELNTYIL